MKHTGSSRIHRPMRFRFDLIALIVLALAAALLAAKGWLDAHPEHNPWAPLDLRDPPGWATARKLAALRDEPALCRAALQRSDVRFDALDPQGEGDCARADRTVLTGFPLAPRQPAMTCPVAAGLELWRTRAVEPAATDILDAPLARIEHLGTYSCRRMYGREGGPWSEHATGNAIDIGAFVLQDGRRISVLTDWPGDSDETRFLRAVRDGACEVFGTVLSPNYNAAHRDHFHLDQEARSFRGVCR